MFFVRCSGVKVSIFKLTNHNDKEQGFDSFGFVELDFWLVKTQQAYMHLGFFNVIVGNFCVLRCFGFWFFIPNVLNLVSILCVFLYLKIGIRLEETKLTEKYGDEYIRYMKEVPAVLPDLIRLLKSNQGGNS